MHPHQPPTSPSGGGLRVELFAGMADAAGRRVLEIDWEGGSVAELRAAVAAAVPAVGTLLSRSAVAVGGGLVSDDRRVERGAEVAIIPPVSGG